MGKKTNFIPFMLIPKYWGLIQNERERAKAHYQLDGEDLDRRLLEIEYSSPLNSHDADGLKKAKLDLDLKWGKIDQLQYERAQADIKYPDKKSIEYRKAMLDIKFNFCEIEEYEYDILSLELLNLNPDSIEYKTKKADIELKHNKITPIVYEKEIETIHGRPWVKVIESDLSFSNEDGSKFSFNLDWNIHFIEELTRAGYVGTSQVEIIDQWFSETCREIFAEEVIEDFDE
jgi:hypothetical protein